MNIVLARIDDRFIHGQVLTRWIKIHASDRIIVVSDDVAADDMRKTLILSLPLQMLKRAPFLFQKWQKRFTVRGMRRQQRCCYLKNRAILYP